MLLDDFNRANENPLSGRWDTLWGGGLKLVSNRVEPSDPAGSGSIWNVRAFGDCEAWVTLADMPAFGYADLYVRMQHPDSGPGYGLWIDGVNDRLVLFKEGSGDLTSVPHVPTIGYGYRIRAEGFRISAAFDDGYGWQEAVAVTDTTYTTGYLALDAGADSGAPAKLDNFGGGVPGWGPSTDTEWPVDSEDRWLVTAGSRWPYSTDESWS